MSKDAQGKFSYNPVSVNLVTEVFKVVFAVLTLMSVVVMHALLCVFGLSCRTFNGVGRLCTDRLLRLVVKHTTIDC